MKYNSLLLSTFALALSFLLAMGSHAGQGQPPQFGNSPGGQIPYPDGANGGPSGSFDGGGYDGGDDGASFGEGHGSYEGSSGGGDFESQFNRPHETAQAILPQLKNSLERLSSGERQNLIDQSATWLVAAGSAGALALTPAAKAALLSRVTPISIGSVAKWGGRALGLVGGVFGVASVVNANESLEGYLEEKSLMSFFEHVNVDGQVWALEHVEGLTELILAIYQNLLQE